MVFNSRGAYWSAQLIEKNSNVLFSVYSKRSVHTWRQTTAFLSLSQSQWMGMGPIYLRQTLSQVAVFVTTKNSVVCRHVWMDLKVHVLIKKFFQGVKRSGITNKRMGTSFTKKPHRQIRIWIHYKSRTEWILKHNVKRYYVDNTNKSDLRKWRVQIMMTSIWLWTITLFCCGNDSDVYNKLFQHYWKTAITSWPWIWLQSITFACPMCEAPHRLQL